jgi:DNA topoisomerase-3
MGKTLIVAEKPSVARDIAAALGGFSQMEGCWESHNAIVSSAIGHLVEIYAPEAATSGKDLATLPVIPARFELQAIEKTRAKYALLNRLMKRADVDQVVNACDAGREGELIFRLIYELAGCRKFVKRAWLQSMTSDAIRDEFNNLRPGSAFDALSDAAKCRAEADWLIGINGSRGITRLRERQTQKYEMMTAGRVQTPTLAIIVHRETAIRTFVPVDYWEVHAQFGAQAGVYVGKWFNPLDKTVIKSDDEDEDTAIPGSRFTSQAQAQAVATKCQGVSPSSVTDESTIVTSAPPKLFDLTGLQREANKMFKFSAKKTLDIAQALYERHKVTSYPRTNATALPEDYVDKTREIIATLDGAPYSEHATRVLTNGWVKPNTRIFDNTKISDHFAIIPTGTRPSGLDASEAQIFDLVVRRFLAAFHPAAEYKRTTRVSVVSDEPFKTTGKILVKRGWLEVYGHQQAGDEKTLALCAVAPGEQVKTNLVKVVALKTEPPKRFTEASLLAAMEGAGKFIDDDELREAMKESGLGTAATRASIIEGLLSAKDGQDRPKEPYVTREGKAQHLVPTDKGMGLIGFLDANGIESLTSPRMTGDWERKLLLMEKGQYQRSVFMSEIETLTRDIIQKIRIKAGELPTVARRVLAAPCPKCKGEIVLGQRTLDCACGFKFWRSIASREMTDDEITVLFRDGAIKQLDGFISAAKKKFSAGLKLSSDAKAEFVFQERNSDAGGPPTAPALKASCPKCQASVHLRGGEYAKYACSKCDFMVWKVIAGRALSESEASTLMQFGETVQLRGFFSASKKKAFDAGLRLSNDKSKIEFVFHR